MVVYNYTVSADGPVTTIQEAINRVSAELATDPILESDIVINITDGSYAGFTIPDGTTSVLLTSVYRLIIKSAGTYFPIIDFNLGSENTVAGVDIGSNNPNISVIGLRVQFFPVGVRSSLNSHFFLIKNCIISNNRNVGILINECDQCQILQNIVVNGDYGIVARLGKDVAIIHNTVFQNAGISSQDGLTVTAIWAELALDLGNGLSDTGTIHFIGNIIWSLSGSSLIFFHDDVERSGAIVSNYNDIVSGGPRYIAIEDRRFYSGSNSRPRRLLTNLSEWKQLGFDTQSIDQNPRFIAPIRVRADRNGFSLDLNLLPVSPVLGKVPSFYVDSSATTSWLPSYVDSSDFATDILGNPRVQVGTAIGANDRATNAGFYGQDILTNPLDLNITKNCNVDPLLDLISNNVEIAYPKIKAGHFYYNEKEFFLYSKKACSTLGELAVTKFRLPSRISYTYPIEVRVNGNLLTDTKYIDIVGDDLYLYHHDLFIVTLDEEIEIQCWTASWHDVGFSYQRATYIYKIRQGETRYYLPKEYVSGPPVIITDDNSCPRDDDFIANREFTLKFNELEQKTEILFANNTNQIINSQFDSNPQQAPAFWSSTGCTVLSALFNPSSVAGENVCAISSSGYLKQLLPFVSGGSVFSLHTINYGDSSLAYNLHCYDHLYNDLGYTLSGIIPSSGEWHRHYLLLGTSGDDYSDLIPNRPFETSLVASHFIPEESFFIDLTLVNIPGQANIPIYVDAVQYEFGQKPTIYHRKPLLNELTVEYETSTDPFYLDRRQAIAAIRNYMTDGFLYITEIPAAKYGGPSHPSITTLYEHGWPLGRKLVIPWARTKGKDKLSYRPNGLFNKFPLPKPEIIVPVGKIVELETVEIFPSNPVVLQGDPNGINITVKCLDTFGNPAANTAYTIWVSDRNINFPGTLYKSLYGLKQQLGPTIIGRLDNAGLVSVTWLPPDKDLSIQVIKIPKPAAVSNTSDSLSFIRTNYPVSLTNHGNICFIDSNGNRIATEGQIITGTFQIRKAGEYSKIILNYPIVPGSIDLLIDNQTLSETYISTPESDQFYVDYESSTILVKTNSLSAYIEYRPSYITINQNNANYITVYHDKVFANYNIGDIITIGYDYSITFNIKIDQENGLNSIFKTFELVAQNYLLTYKNMINTIALEL